MKSQRKKSAELEAKANAISKDKTISTVLPDECGDSLWDEVLKERPKRITVRNKPAGSLPEDVVATTQHDSKLS